MKRKTLRISNRREAIKSAVMLACPGDIILVAGKGHETYQEINGVKHHFDDREELKAALQMK
ncbi:MAG: UDP-N-acetylmuramoyl-L-alanyl-D-glutamate--2,6-diaminopimelate ligase, partial [Bacteroidales bacterium]|nr:UDP-N-acetylmuramoyl-L-alanyl-D-glutamate--2,6-diaminopimelate ligase [Bacteroidales bacterium]